MPTGIARASGVACAWVFLLGACASPQPVPVESSAGARALLERRLDDPRLQQFISSQSLQVPQTPETAESSGRPPPPPSSSATLWDLDRLTLAALYFHPDLPIARSRVRMAQAHAVGARARPGQGLSASLGRGAGAGLVSPWIVGAAIDFVLEAGDRRALRAAQADALVDAARADLRQASWSVRSRVYTALLDCWSAQRRIEPLRDALDLQSRRADLYERRVESGENARADLRRELAQREQLTAALAQAQADLAQSRADLAQAIGVSLAALDGIDLDLGSMDRAPQVDGSAIGLDLRERALTGRADVQDALAQIAAAQAELQTELSRRWPDARLGPGYQFDLGANKYAVTMGLDWPRAVDGPIAEAAARRELAARQLLALQARVLAQFDHAMTLWQSVASMAESARSLVAQAGQREQAAAAQFAAGALDRPSLLGARLDLIEAERARRLALERQRRALAALEDTVQAPLEPGRREPVAPVAEPGPGVAAAQSP